MPDPYRYFRIEARDLADKMLQGALDLEKDPADRETVVAVLRLAHTLKGAARVVKQREIADGAHAIEDVLSPARDADIDVVPASIEAVLSLLDEIRAHVDALDAPPDETAPVERGASPEVDASQEPIRVPTVARDADVLLDNVREAHVHLDVLRRASLDPELAAAVERVDRELGEIRSAAEQLRFVAASTLFTDLERAVRDVAAAQGKRVRFEALGGDIRLDAQVVAAAHSALQQIVRNAVAHGIEPESERRAAGKAPEGTVTIEVIRGSRTARFLCRDDGRGIDLEAVRGIARARGLISQTSQQAGADELLQLLLRGGISTSAAVTEVAGRGIGLDLARDAVERAGGTITVTTDAGVGTTVLLELPLSTAALDALVVEAAGRVAALPLDAVRATARATADDVSTAGAGWALQHDEQLVPFVPLADLLAHGASESARADTWCALITNDGVAIGVDRLHGTADLVVRPLPALAPASSLVSGTWLDVDGTPQLVLDPAGLARAARAPRDVSIGETPTLAPILVVDDSVTTRMLEQSILESAGYAVEVAASAEEALAKAQDREYSLFLVDVEMPGMDGFGFVEATRASPTTRDTPAVLVTSRASAADRQRGVDAGASGYVTKGAFDQGELLALIRELIEA